MSDVTYHNTGEYTNMPQPLFGAKDVGHIEKRSGGQMKILSWQGKLCTREKGPGNSLSARIELRAFVRPPTSNQPKQETKIQNLFMNFAWKIHEIRPDKFSCFVFPAPNFLFGTALNTYTVHTQYLGTPRPGLFWFAVPRP